jgi:REP element-mobilizing transposase RayT
MSDPHDDFNSDRIPLGYLITFRAHGTWLHGDSRGSVDRFHNDYGTPCIPGDLRWERYNDNRMKLEPVKLDAQRRAAINEAIQETCDLRGWNLWTQNVRTNHVHAVVTASCDPELVLRALKANATRKMREAGCWQSSQTPWARKGSKRWLWTHDQRRSAIGYVEDEQGPSLP